jgi:ATP-dependent Clp protease ATP-binding subunit ClpA
MKIMNLNNLMENTLEVANSWGSKYADVATMELALLEIDEFQEAFLSEASENDLDELRDKLEDLIEKIPAYDAEVIKRYQEAGKELDIRFTSNLAAFQLTATMISTTMFFTQAGNCLMSHVLYTLIQGGEGSTINSYAMDHVIDLDNVVDKMVEIEMKELRISTSEPESVASPLGGLFGLGQPQQQVDWKKFVTDLTAKASSYKKPFIGREDVIHRAIQVLSRMEKSNPIFVGEPGVGKTEITIGLAKMIAEDKVPKQIKGATLYSVDLAGMIAGTKYRGEFEARLKALLEGVKDQNVILFFDEIHQVVGCGATSGSAMDASNILKPYLTEGSIKFIGATTYKEFKDNIEKDHALMRRFQKVDVKEPTIEEAIEIINGIKDAYGKYHGVTYTDAAVKAAVELTDKYVHERFLPDKAIDMIDEAGAAISIMGETTVDEAQIEDVISVLCKIPKKTVKSDEFAVVNELSNNLRNVVFGQDVAIDQIVDAIKLSKSGLGDDNKPIASFLFVGPTGTGKTEIAKQLAANLGIELVRFDMSEYMEENSISKLIGTSAGYVGYENGGLLTEAILKTPHCVLLLDEIEKAHPAIFKSFLQVMDYGQLTDNQGRIADFRNVVIIMTSNAGAQVAAKRNMGFGIQKEEINTDGIDDAVKNLFPPEFRNRLTKTVIFNGINDEIGRMVAKKELGLLDAKLAKRNITAEYTDECIDELVRRGVSPEFGAREIQRLINSQIKVKFVDRIVSGSRIKKYVVDYNGTEFTVESSRYKKAKKELEETTV